MNADGWTYVVACRGSNFVKIGSTNREVEERLRQMQPHCPYEFEIVLKRPGRELEWALHWLFAEYRHDHEWYRNEGALAECIGWLMGGQ